MSLRPRVGGHSTTDDRFSRVLAAGAGAGAGALPAVYFSTNNKRAAVDKNNSPGAISFLNLPDDLILKIAEAFVSENDCSEIGRFCSTNEFNDFCQKDSFWKKACQIKEYDTNFRT